MERTDITQEQVVAGQAVYTKRTLRAYDLVVLGISNRFIWKCPTRRVLEHYQAHVTANHADIGVGTGYFPDKCRFPTPNPRIALIDLNQSTLEYASRRIARYRPETYRRNVLEPIHIDAPKFDSIALGYLLHCLPGSMATKSVVFDHAKALMNPGAVLFGSTLLQGGVERSAAAKRLMKLYNKKGIFSNESDDLDRLTEALGKRFTTVSVEVVGCAALFAGRA